MKDLPEPEGSRPVSRNLPMRQGIRLNSIEDLEEV